MPRDELEIILRLRDEATRALKRAQGALKGLEGELKRAKAAAERLNAEIERAAPASRTLMAAVAGATAAIGGLGVKAIATAGQFEQMRIAFTTMLGSAEKADRFLRKLYDFAAKTPFEIEGLQQQVQLLLALGFKAEEVIPTLRAVGDAVAALGGGADLLNRVVLALGQIRAKGKVSAEEMRQLAEAGIPAWEMLAKKIGTDIPTAMKLAEKGAIDAATGVSAILEGMNRRFAGMMDVQSRTLLGIWSNIKDNLTRTLAALGDQIDKTFHVREGMQAFLDWLNKVRAWFEEGGLQRALRSSKELILGLAGAIAGALTPAIVQAARGLALFVARLAPWALAGYAAVRALEALGVSLTDLKRWAALGAQALVGLTKVGQAVVEDFSGIVAFWRSALGGMLDAFKRALFFLDRAWEAIKNKNIEGARFALQTAATALTGSMKQAFDQAASESAGFFDRANKLAEDGLTKIFETVDGTLGDVAEKVKAAFGDIEEKVKSASQTIVKLAKGANAPLPSLANGYQAAGDAAKKAAEKVKDFNDELKRQLGLLGQRSPREATGGPYAAIVNEPGHGDIAGRNAGLIPPSYGGRGARRGGGGVLAEQRRRYRELLADASKLTAAERDRRQALAEIAAEQERLNELAKEHLEYQQAMLRAREMEIARTARLVREASKLTQAELDRRRAAREVAGMPDASQQQLAMYQQYQRLRLRSRQAHEAFMRSHGAPEGLPPGPSQDVAAMYQQYQQSRMAARAPRANPLADLFAGVSQSIGNLLAALNPFAAILQKINPIGEILAAMLEKLAPALEPISTIFAEMGSILADVLLPVLKALAPVISFVGRVFKFVAGIVAGIWNAIASAINSLLGWLGVHIELIKFDTEKSLKKKKDAEKPPTTAPPKPPSEDARRIRYELPTAPVLAAPKWVDEMGRHVATFGKAVNQFAQVVDRSSGSLAWSVRGVA